MPLLVSAKNRSEHLFRQPAIQQTQLLVIVDMLEIVIEDGNVAQAFTDGFSRQGNERRSFLLRISDFLPAAAASAEGEAKQVLDLAQLVAREGDSAIGAKEQTEMAKLGGGREARVARLEPGLGLAPRLKRSGERKVTAVAGFHLQTKFGQR